MFASDRQGIEFVRGRTLTLTFADGSTGDGGDRCWASGATGAQLNLSWVDSSGGKASSSIPEGSARSGYGFRQCPIYCYQVAAVSTAGTSNLAWR